jgi:L-ascorbate metabolism protein UlaG (beta-lactamase superfamily)
MVITYHGGEFFKATFGDTTVAFNPISKDSKLKGTRFGADIVLVSLNHPDFNGADQMSYGEREPLAITGPGEYEVKKVFIRGFPSKSGHGGEDRINTVYSVQLEGMNLCFLGALRSRKDLTAEVKGELGDIDILFVPIGDEGVLSASDAHELAVELEPRLIIPMHYGEIGKKDALKNFLEEEGSGNGEPQEKLTVKKKDIEEKVGEIVVLSA